MGLGRRIPGPALCFFDGLPQSMVSLMQSIERSEAAVAAEIKHGTIIREILRGHNAETETHRSKTSAL